MAMFYCRDPSHYSRTNLPARYIPDCYRYRSMMPAAEWLLAEGLAEEQRTAPSPHAQHRSRLRASASLIAVCNDLEVVSRPKELIILKDAEGKLQPYHDSRLVDRMRGDVCDQNEAIETVKLTISDACDAHDAHGRLYRDLYRRRSLVRPLRRIFNGGWKKGGRWYGVLWQNLPKRVRAQLLIDGEAVVELDFRTCHPRLLCALAGVDLPFHDAGFDYYDLPGFDRTHVKRAFNVLINAASERAAVMALAQALRAADEPAQFAYARYLVSAAMTSLPALAHSWRPSIGLHLQYRDAEICARVQRVFRRKGIAVLSIHDSFIVAERHADVLRQVMEDEMEVECRKLR